MTLQNHRRDLLTLTFGGVALLSVAIISPAQSLGDAVRNGLENSPKVREAVESAKASFFDIDVAKSSLRPQISSQASAGAAFRDRSVDGVATGSGETRFSREARVTVQQLLFDWGASGKLVNSAEFRNEFQKLLVEDMQGSQALVIVETYLDLYQYQLRSESYAEHISELKKLEEDAEGRKEGKTNGIVIRSKIANSKAKKSQVDARVKALAGRFEILTQMEADSISLPRAPRDLDQVVDLSGSPRVKAAQMAIKSSKANLAALKKDHLPKVFLEGRGGLGEDVLGIDGPDNEWSALAVVRWNPYQGGKKIAMVRKTEREVARDQAALEDVELVIKDEIALAQADLSGADERRMAIDEAKIELAEALDSYDELVKAKQAGILNKVNTRTELLNATIESYNAMIDAYKASYRGMESSGQLLDYLGVATK